MKNMIINNRNRISHSTEHEREGKEKENEASGSIYHPSYSDVLFIAKLFSFLTIFAISHFWALTLRGSPDISIILQKCIASSK